MKHFRARHFAVAVTFASFFTAIAQEPLPDGHRFMDDNHIRYEVVDGAAGIAKVSSLSSCQGSVTVPSIVTTTAFGADYTFQVTGIGEAALETFSSGTTELQLTLSEGIEYLEDNALAVCGYGKMYITSISLPSTLKSIGMTPFYDQALLKELTLPASVTTFGVTPLDGLNLDTLYFNSKKVTSTNSLFASYQSLGKLVIGPDVQILDNKLFGNLKKISSIEIADGGSALFLSTGSFANTAESTLSNVYLGRDLVYTDAGSDLNNDRQSVFQGLESLTEVTIGREVTALGTKAFYSCPNLSRLTFAADGALQTIGIGAFWATGLSGEIQLPAGIRKIDQLAFAQCGFTGMKIQPGLTEIANQAFYGCSAMTSIQLPDGVKTLGKNVFYNCNALKELHIGNGIETIGEGSLAYMRGVEKISIGEGLKEFPMRGMFNDASLTEIVLPSTLETINAGAVFWGCSSLKKFSVPGSVKMLYLGAFNQATIEEVVLEEGEPLALTVPSDPNYNLPGSLKSFTCLRQLELTFENESSSDGLFANCTSLENITLGGKMTAVPASFAFRNRYVKSLELSGDIESVGNQAFWGASNLTSLTLNTPKLKTVGVQAFYNAGLTGELILPAGVELIDEMAFQRCQFSKIVIPASVKSIGVFAFDSNWTLDEVIFEDSVEALAVDCNEYSQHSIFSYGVKKAYIGRNIGFLRDKLWYTDGSIQLTDLTIGDYVTDVTKLALPENKSLENLSIGAGVRSLPAMPLCTALRTINLSSPEPPVAGGFAPEVYENATVLIPRGSERAYYMADVWKNFFTGRIPVLDLDAAGARYAIGEGDSKAMLLVKFGSAPLMDNFVWQYNYDGAMPEPADIVAAVATADERFSAEIADGMVSYASFDIDFSGSINDRDASATNSDSAMWQFTDALAADGVTPVVILSYAPEAAEGEDAAIGCDYTFFVPAPDALGVFMPAGLNLALSDNAPQFPVVYNTGERSENPNTLYWSISADDAGSTSDKTVISSISSKGSYPSGEGRYTGKTGTVYVAARSLIGGGFMQSDFCAVNIGAPLKPVTAISFADAAVTSGLNKNIVNELTIEPADATYTAMTIATSDSKIVTVSSYDMSAKSTRTAGTAQVTISYVYNPEVSDSYYVATRLMNPVTDVTFEGAEGDVINVPVKQLIGLRPIVSPADADIPDVTITLSDNGTSREDYTCTTYRVNYWDENNVRSQFYELSGHRPTGDNPAKVHVVSADGTFTKDFTVNVIEADRTPLEGGYTDGTILLNEEWFGHTNGGLNYLTADNEIIYQAYEKENPGMSFGATSCHGTIWNGKLIVMSKQARDGGDLLPGGGRLVIADAATMKRLGSLDDLVWGEVSGDGRAVAGATPDKIYAGSNNGIFIVDISDAENPVITGMIGGTDSGADLYSGQIGDMVSTRRYVFAVKQGSPLAAIDVNTDEIVAQFGANVQGVTQSADGNVWLAMPGDDANTRLICIDPETLQEVETVELPARAGRITCGWGAWRPTQFTASRTANELWFCDGGAGISGGGEGSYYCYEIGSDPENVREVFSLKEFNEHTEGMKQQTYGQLAIDDRNDQLYVMTTVRGAASGQYRDHWFNRVDRNSGELIAGQHLNPYYWFQAMCIFPDKYEPEIDFDDVLIEVDGKTAIADTAPAEYDLTDCVTDADNLRANIRLTAETTLAPESRSQSVAEVSLDGNTLTIRPLAIGVQPLTLTAESNGRSVSKTVQLAVSSTSGVDNIAAGNASISCDGRRVTIDGCEGSVFEVFDLAGRRLISFDVDSDHYVLDMTGRPGAYIISGDNGLASKIVIK